MKIGTILALAAIGGMLYECRFRTDMAADKLAGQYDAAIAHPADTQRVVLKAVVTHTENTSHCNELVFDIRSYKPGQEQEIENFYKDKKLTTQENYALPLGFFFVKKYEGYSLDKKVQEVLATAKAKTADPLYLVTFGIAGPQEAPPLGDLRCW